MNAIPPGTPCFLVGSTASKVADVIGRVVVVVAGPREEWGDGPGPFYDVRADWIESRFPGRDIIVRREHLRPIIPGEGMDAVPTEETVPAR